LFSFQRQDAISAATPDLQEEVSPELSADYPLALEASLMSSHRLQLLIVAQDSAMREEKLQALMDQLEISLTMISRDVNGSVWSEQGHCQEHDGIVRSMAIPTTESGPTIDPKLGAPQFTWTADAVAIREEMAALAGVIADNV